MGTKRWWVALVLVAVVACGDDAGDPAVSADVGSDDATTQDVSTPGEVSEDAAPPGDGGGEDTSAPDAPADPGSGEETDAMLPTTCLSPDVAEPIGVELVEPLGTASVSTDDPAACHRTYTLSTTATLKDGLPSNPRTIVEVDGEPTVRTGNLLFDALYALALAEVEENAVEQIQNGAFDDGTSVGCGDGGCFETGRKWTYVWTRDTAYAVDLGLAAVDPVRARNSLLFKLSERREGGDLQVVQDTGSGGSYPVSSDRVAWALGAWALLHQLEGAERAAFLEQAFEALRNTLEHDRETVFDATVGLYTGEQSFLDWREQTYPLWTEHDVVDIATSRALSTNVLHLRALEIATAMAAEVGEAAAESQLGGWAQALRGAIVEHLWLPAEGMFSTFVPNFLDPSAARRYDLLGSSLAVLAGLADASQASSILAGYPHYGPGAPVIWPQQQVTKIYHNRGEWPFVTAYWLRAAKVARNDAVATRMVRALVRGAALNLSNMENFEAGSGAAWLDDGFWSGPVVNSQRQLWSVAGYISMVTHTLFGLEATAEGLRVRPYLTKQLRADLFAAADTLVLNDAPYRGRKVTALLHLPPVSAGAGSYQVAAIRLDGVPITGDLIAPGDLGPTSRLDVDLVEDAAPAAGLTEVADADWKDVFGPRTPAITGVVDDGGKVRLDLSVSADEQALVTLTIYRDGEAVTTGLPGTTTSWTDPASSTLAPASPCYAVEATFTGSGNHSQHSRAACWWADGAVQIFTAESFAVTGGAYSEEHGEPHYGDWGDPGHTLEVGGIAPIRTGPHLVQVRYGNGSGPVNTGITCGVKLVTVQEEATGAVVGAGPLIMPQRGGWAAWALSTFVRADLDAGKTYRVTVASDPSAINMSSLAHFAKYTGGTGGVGGIFNRVNISQVRVLAR